MTISEYVYIMNVNVLCLIDVHNFFFLTELFDVQTDKNYGVRIEPGLIYGETDAQAVLSCGPFRGMPYCECNMNDLVHWEVVKHCLFYDCIIHSI